MPFTCLSLITGHGLNKCWGRRLSMRESKMTNLTDRHRERVRETNKEESAVEHIGIKMYLNQLYPTQPNVQLGSSMMEMTSPAGSRKKDVVKIREGGRAEDKGTEASPFYFPTGGLLSLQRREPWGCDIEILICRAAPPFMCSQGQTPQEMFASVNIMTTQISFLTVSISTYQGRLSGEWKITLRLCCAVQSVKTSCSLHARYILEEERGVECRLCCLADGLKTTLQLTRKRSRLLTGIKRRSLCSLGVWTVPKNCKRLHDPFLFVYTVNRFIFLFF